LLKEVRRIYEYHDWANIGTPLEKISVEWNTLGWLVGILLVGILLVGILDNQLGLTLARGVRTLWELFRPKCWGYCIRRTGSAH